MKGFSTRLKAARKAKRLTQVEIAEQLHIHRTAYTKYECGRAQPTLENLVKIAAILNVTTDELLIPR